MLEPSAPLGSYDNPIGSIRDLITVVIDDDDFYNSLSGDGDPGEIVGMF